MNKKPSLQEVSKIIQICDGNPFAVSKTLKIPLPELEKYEALWPNDKLKKWLEREENLAKELIEREEIERKERARKRLGKPSLEKIKEIAEKYNGDRDKICEELGYSKDHIGHLLRRVKHKYKEFDYYRPLRDFGTYNIFPTNEERIYYKDNPHVKYLKDGTKRCLDKKKEEA